MISSFWKTRLKIRDWGSLHCMGLLEWDGWMLGCTPHTHKRYVIEKLPVDVKSVLMWDGEEMAYVRKLKYVDRVWEVRVRPMLMEPL